jgi:hypothetical protein
LPYIKVVGLINEIQAQCGPQLAEAENEQWFITENVR